MSAPTLDRGALRWAFADAATITWRNLVGLVRLPQLIVFSVVQPVMFVLLFRYVFGGAIPVPGHSYVDYLMPGVFVQTVLFGAIQTAIGLAEDLGKGLIERFRSLPMARSAVLAGRTLADLVRNCFIISLMIAMGYAVGFRAHTSWFAFLAAVGLMLYAGYAFSWLLAVVGLVTGDAESAQAAAFPLLFPLTFASSAFVPTATMPGWLQAFARANPVTVITGALRVLCLGGPTARPALEAAAWLIALLAVTVPAATASYRHATST